MKGFASLLQYLIAKTEREGAMTPYIAATQPNVVNGGFYSDGLVRPHAWQASMVRVLA